MGTYQWRLNTPRKDAYGDNLTFFELLTNKNNVGFIKSSISLFRINTIFFE